MQFCSIHCRGVHLLKILKNDGDEDKQMRKIFQLAIAYSDSYSFKVYKFIYHHIQIEK